MEPIFLSFFSGAKTAELAAREFAESFFYGDIREIESFKDDNTFSLVGGVRTYRVLLNPEEKRWEISVAQEAQNG